MNKEERIQELCSQIQSGDNTSALEAVDELREHGWLTDRSLNGVDLNRSNLEGANLQSCQMFNVNFLGANLNNVDFSHADLRGSSFYGARITNANLEESILQGCNLTGAVLENSSLIGAILTDTNLTLTILDNANFTNVLFNGTLFHDIDLSTVYGLESVRHRGKSYLAFDTFIKSNGRIPEEFLRGCGIPEQLIVSLSSMIVNPIQYYSCFISYSHAQKEFARRLHDRLQGAGIRCWLDEHQVKPGQDIYEEVNRGIRLWDKVLLCCSEESLTSWWVDNEIGVALEKEQRLMKERSKKILSIIPLNLDGYLFSGEWQSGYEAQIRRRLAADFTNWKDHDGFEAEFQKVLAALRTDEGREEPPVSRL